MTNLERMRRERDWRQSDLAKEAGVPQSSISRAENGGSISIANAVRVARALGSTVEELFGDMVDVAPDAEPVEDITPTPGTGAAA